MRLSEVTRPECLAVGLEVRDKAAALEEIARLAGKCPCLKQVARDAILKGFADREALGSTGIGEGIAIPHCRLEGVSEFVVGAMTVPKGVDFDAADGLKVRIVVFIIAPLRETTEHLRLLSAISLALGAEGVVDEIVDSDGPEKLLESLVRHARDETNLKERANKRLLQVVVQDDNIFPQLLGALVSVDSASAVVVDGRHSGEYLMRVPLFADLFGDGNPGFCRVILVVIERAMTNEAVRRIESVTGRLDERRDVLLIIQDLFFAAGALEA